MVPDKLLIVDDEEDMLEGLRRRLAGDLPGVEIATAASGREAIGILKAGPVDVALCDIRMPEMDGLELLESLRRIDPSLTVIMMTAHGSIETAVEAMKAGAYDFVTKPFDMDALLRVIMKGLERNRLIRENRSLKERVGDGTDFYGFVGRSAPMRRLYDTIRSIAPTDYTVLIRGESGTGKELAARAIHALSRRSDKKLITVNCPAVPEHLLESEFFGHKKGAFTGAERDQAGLFREADGGALLLDEIGDIPVSIQTKLLRVLQEQEIRPLGASETVNVDVRIIASTNRDIEDEIKKRNFREDLFYRLNVFPLVLPPLREIREDVPHLAAYFAKTASTKLNLPPRRFDSEALELLTRHDWPGNVRELQNLVRRVVVFSPGEEIGPAALNEIRTGDPCAVWEAFSRSSGEEAIIEPYKDVKERMLGRFTQRYVTELLKQTNGNVTKAAELSGLGRPSLQKIMKRMNLRSDEFKE